MKNTISPKISLNTINTTEPPMPIIKSWRAEFQKCSHKLPYKNILDLSQAVPNYAPPEDLLKAAAECALKKENYFYAPIAGQESLRIEIARHYNEKFSIDLSKDDFLVVAGANYGFYLAAVTLLEPGDEVILVEPYYFNNHTTLTSIGAVPVSYRADPEKGLLPDISEIKEVITPRTRAISLVTPNNPAGTIYSRTLMEEFAELCLSRKIWLIVDEVYQDFYPLDQNPETLLSHKDWRKFLIHLFSLSKSFSFTGLRIGFIVADTPLRSALMKNQDSMLICAPALSQAISTEALRSHRPWVQEKRGNLYSIFKEFQTFMRDNPGGFKMIAGGAFFAYLEHPYSNKSSWDVAHELAVNKGIMTTPGEVFGPSQKKYLRAAFGNATIEELRSAISRLKS